MTVAGAELLDSAIRHLSNSEPIVTFPTTGGGSWPVWYRFLALRGEKQFQIGNICGTCEFWFERLSALGAPIEIAEAQRQLSTGLLDLDSDVVSAFGRLLQSGKYSIGLFRLVPQLVMPGSADDYFSREQVDAWSDRSNDEPPNDPLTAYYRVGGRSGLALNPDGDECFEFIAPLQRPESLDLERVHFFEEKLEGEMAPTAVAVAILDIKQFYDSRTAHWCLCHYLLDGHHKIQAAARTAKPVTLLSFISHDHSIQKTIEDIDHLLSTYGHEVCN